MTLPSVTYGPKILCDNGSIVFNLRYVFFLIECILMLRLVQVFQYI
jgi:hypothetical protein